MTAPAKPSVTGLPCIRPCFLKSSREIEKATSEIATTFLILDRFHALLKKLGLYQN